MDKTLIIFKPDAMQRRLVGQILARFERKGLKLVGLKLVQVTRELAETHYEEHKERPFFGVLVDFITKQPVIVGVLAGPNVVPVVRKMLGATFGHEAEAGTIRGDYSISRSYNLVHGSDSPESAEREIALWFAPGEVQEWAPLDEPWVFSDEDA